MHNIAAEVTKGTCENGEWLIIADHGPITYLKYNNFFGLRSLIPVLTVKKMCANVQESGFFFILYQVKFKTFGFPIFDIGLKFVTFPQTLTSDET